MNDNVFYSVMHDLTDHTFGFFCRRLIEQNVKTGNLLGLLEQTVSRLRQMINRKIAPSPQNVEQCCCALQISSLVMSYLCSHLAPNKIRIQLNLPAIWPQQIIQQTQEIGHVVHSQQINSGEFIVRALIDELLCTIQSHPILDWYHDIIYYSSNLLLNMLTTQLYQVDDRQNKYSSGDDTDNTAICCGSDNLFLNYIYVYAHSQLRSSLERQDRDVSGTCAGRLVKGLINHILHPCRVPRDSLVTDMLKVGWSARTSSSQLQRHVTVDWTQRLLEIFPQAYYFHNIVTMPLHAVRAVLGVVGVSVTSTARLLSLALPVLTHISGSHSTSLLPTSDPARLSVESSVLVRSSNYQQRFPDPLGSAVRSVRRSPYSSVAGDFVLPEKARSLLLLLMCNRRLAHGVTNAIRECFCLLTNEDSESIEDGDDDEMYSGQSAGMRRKLYISYSGLIKSVNRDLPGNTAALLLYALLHTHPTFLHDTIRSGFANSILLSLLQSLVQSVKNIGDDKRPPRAVQVDHIYVLMACTLLLAQESSFRSILFETAVTAHDLGWFSERNIGKLSLGSLLVLVLMKVALLALFRLQDSYLLGNCLTGIISLSTTAADVEHYFCERLVTVTFRLMKRLVRKGRAPGPASAGCDMEADVAYTLKIFLIFLGTCLRPQTRSSNICLLYALLLLDTNGELSSVLQHPVVTHLFHPHNRAAQVTPPTPVPPSNITDDPPLRSPVSLAPPSTTPLRTSRSKVPTRPSSMALHSNSPPTNNLTPQKSHSNVISSPSPLVVIGDTLSQSSGVLWPADVAVLMTVTLQQLQETYNLGSTFSDAASSLDQYSADSDVESKFPDELPAKPSSLANLPAAAADAVEALRRIVLASLSPRGNGSLDGSVVGSQESSDVGVVSTGYLYEEGEDPEQFFTPHTWASVVISSPECSWNLDRVALFGPDVISLVQAEKNDMNSGDSSLITA